MPTSPLNTAILHLLADVRPGGCGTTDGELLARFLRGRDDDALAGLVWRHAPMVWGVCRRLLNHHEAEDAFQATFLVLVRKAADVPRRAVANWLYGVARQTAVRLRATAAKRGRREKQVVTMPEPAAESQGSAIKRRECSDLQSALDEELSRLPEHYRGVIVLCELEGLTRKEAARQLGIPAGSVASRLARARALLAKRLSRRGVGFSGGSVAGALSAASASASAPPALVTSTIRAASLLAAGRAAGVVSAQVGALTEGVVKAMFVTKMKSALAVVLVVATLAAAGGLIYQAQAAEEPKGKGTHVIASERKREVEQPQNAGEPPASPKPARSDRERMVGNWFIVNEDSGRRKGEMWVIYEDWILMNAKDGGANAHHYSHRLDAGKNPKQIDITATVVNGPVIGVIKGIYVLDGDELRLCLGEMGKDRPAAFPEKPKPGEVLVLQRATSGATPPKAKEQVPAHSDQERMVGDWVVTYAGSKFPEHWTITKDRIDRHSPGGGWQMQWYHRLDAGKDPKQIDIAGQLNGPPVIKGIYALDGDELRLCLGAAGKDRPAAFPEKPKPREVLILHRQKPIAEAPKAKEEPPAKSDLERIAGLWTIVNGERQWRDDGLGAKGQYWDIGTYQIVPDPFLTGVRTRQYFHRLDAAKSPKQIDITVTTASNKIGTEFPIDPKNRILGLVKGIYELDRGEFRLCLGEMGKDRPTAFPEKPKQGEVLILHRYEPRADGGAPDGKEKLRVLIDQVLAAHGGEEKLSKLQFTMTVKHSNGYINQYFVQPPTNFRWEQQHRDQKSKMIVILFPEGRRWWTKARNEEPKGFMPTGVEAPLKFWHDYVKFFGPRQVLRLRDADHKVALLDQETRIGDRAAVGVQITGPLCTQKMYFDKETHLLLQGVGSDIAREVTFSDYKTFDGIPIPTQEHDGHFEPRVTDFKVVEKFDLKLFERP